MKRTTKPTCYACEEPAGRTAIAVTNLYDGEVLTMHRACILKIIDKIALDEGDEELAAQLHHQLNVQGLFKDGDTVVRTRKAGALKRPMNTVAFSTEELMAAEPIVPQHPIGWVPEDDEEAAAAQS